MNTGILSKRRNRGGNCFAVLVVVIVFYPTIEDRNIYICVLDDILNQFLIDKILKLDFLEKYFKRIWNKIQELKK